jgi:hypothetical protein
MDAVAGGEVCGFATTTIFLGGVRMSWNEMGLIVEDYVHGTTTAFSSQGVSVHHY